jgi:hypothetical protein
MHSLGEDRNRLTPPVEAGRSPRDRVAELRKALRGPAMMIALEQHTRAGIEENLWDTTPGKRLTSVQMIEKHVCIGVARGVNFDLVTSTASGDEITRQRRITEADR